MNQQDVYLVNMRELYARRIHKEPVWREIPNERTPYLTPGQEPGSDSAMFIVDWQMECTEIHVVEDGYSRSGTEIYDRKAEGWNPEGDPYEREPYTNVFDW